MRFALFLWVIVLLSAGAPSRAQTPPSVANVPDYIGVENSTPPLSLGHGFVQNNLMKVPPYSCFSGDEPVDDPEPPSDIKITFTTSSSADSFLSSMGVDLEASYHSIATSVDTKFAYSQKVATDSYSVTTLLTVLIDYPNRRIKNLKLKDEFRALLSQDDAAFVNQCGARVATTQKRGIRLYVLVTIDNASASLRQAMFASISGSYGVGPLSASAKAQFNQEMQSNKSTQHVNVQVFGRGGNTSVGLDDLIRASVKGKTSLDEMGQALGNLIKSLSSKNATALGYYVSDIPEIDIAKRDPWSLEKQARLKRMFRTYATLDAKRTILDNLVRRVDPRYVTYRDDQLFEMQEQIERIDDALLALVAAHGDCRLALPPDLAACATLPPVVVTALTISTPNVIKKPGTTFAIGVREGEVPQNSGLAPWRIASIEEADAVFLSPVGNGDKSTNSSDYLDYLTHFKMRLRSAAALSQRFQQGIAVRGEDVLSAELLARLDPSFISGIPDSLATKSLKAWGRDDLRLHVTAGKLGLFKEYGRGFGPEDLFFRMNADYVDRPPQNCGTCSEYAEAAFKPRAGDLPFQKESFDLIGSWLYVGAKNKNTAIKEGEATILLRVKDRYFPDMVETKLVRLRWTDTGISAGSVANSIESVDYHYFDVYYQFETGEKAERARIKGTFAWKSNLIPCGPEGCIPISSPSRPQLSAHR